MCRGLGNNIGTGNLPSVKEIICIMFWKEKSDPGTKSWEEKKPKHLLCIFPVFGKNFTGDIKLFFLSK